MSEVETSRNTELHNLCKDITNKIYKNLKGNNIHDDRDDNKKITNLVNQILPEIEKEFCSVKKRKKTKLPHNEMCMSRKIDGERCTRRRLDGIEYCKCHNKKRPNGRYDEDMPIKIKGKRGRRRKYVQDPRLFDDNYITVWEEIIEGDRYLIDNDCRVFTYDPENPVYLGIKTLECTIDKKSATKLNT